MAKKLNSTIGVNLAFTADTDRAKRQLQDLQNQLSKIISQPMQLQINDTNMTQKLREASLAAADLKVHLEKATNVDTGTLDFSKLSQSIKQSGTSLNEYANKIKEIGPAGQQAFLSLAQSVASAEIPIRRSNKLVTEMWTSLKNTARWQISSSVLHGFTGALQSAYGYAEDLNESLNDIRIVTGQSIDQMADFAREANKAAKALSTTTTEYTKASLIYYQQGLSDKEVKDRTDITIKMANAAGENAERVSDQLTAVWNNFYDGSKSLEYYADVMTALGAATASSTEEISTGLNKFAAIAETVGLSYEYAASALATVTATTRQSADIVGTAFKTLFARIQDLELGKTLDDGTTLGKYSAALDTIGVNIKDDNDNLKEMDQILEEMAAKWNTISKDEQTALAQTVAGTRQYTQLVALMENWDFMQQNLGTSYGATGTLNEQAEIYAESWEAARDRVQASLETIYEKLLDDEFFIKLLNGLEKTITGVDKLIDSMGGLKGVLSVVGVMATKIFEKQLSQSLQNLSYNMKMMTESGRRSVQKERENIIDQAIAATDKKGENETEVERFRTESMTRQLKLQSALTANASKMSEIELSRNRYLLDRQTILENQTLELKEQLSILQAQRDQQDTELLGEYLNKKGDIKNFIELRSRLNKRATADIELADLNVDAEDFQSQLRNITKNTIPDEDLKEIFSQGKYDTSEQRKAIVEALRGTIQSYSYADIKTEFGDDRVDDIITNYYNNTIKGAIKAKKVATKGNEEVTASFEDLNKTLNTVTGSTVQVTDRIVASANAAMSVVSAWTMLKNAWETIEDPDTSGWEKLLTVMTTMSMAVPSLVSGLNSLKTVFAGSGIADKIPTGFKKATFSKEDNEELERLRKQYSINKNKDGSIDFIDVNAKNGNKIVPNKKRRTTLKSIKKDEQLKDILNQGEDVSKKTSEDIKQYQRLEANKLATGKAGLLKSVAGWGILAGIILASVVAIQALDKAYNKNAIAAQKAAKAAEELNKQYAEATDKYNELKSTISEYDSARKAIDDLTLGTTEYTDAVNEANDASLRLLDTYADIIGNNYTIGSNGLITINEDALDTIKRQEQDSMLLARAAAQAGEQSAREAKLTADITELNRKKIKSKEGWDNDDANRTALGGAIGAGGAAAGLAALGATGVISTAATIGTAAIPVPIVGTLIGLAAGAIVAGTVSAVTKNSETDDETKAVNKLLEAYEEQGDTLFVGSGMKDALNEIGITSEDLIAELEANKEEIKALCEENKKNTLATEAETRALVAQLNADNEKVAGSKYADAINTFAGKRYQQNLDNITNENFSEYSITKHTWAAGGSKEEWEEKGYEDVFDLWFGNAETKKKLEKLFSDYAAENKLEFDKINKVTSNGDIKYKVDGETETLSFETLISWLSAKEATDQNTATSEEIANILTRMKEQDVSILSAGMKQDMSALTLKDLEVAQTTSNLGGLSDDQLKVLGFEGSAAEVSEDIQKQALKAIEDIQKYADSKIIGVGDLTKALISSADETIKSLSQITLKQYANTLDTIIYSGGQDLGTQFTTALHGIMSQYSSHADDIMAIANEIDWTDWDAVTQFNYQLQQIGINIDEGSENWLKFVENVKSMNLSVVHRDFDKLRNQLADIQKITKNISLGSLISDDDYKKIMEVAPALKEAFMMTADGYKYIGSDKINADEALLTELSMTKAKNTKANNLYSYLTDTLGYKKEFNWSDLANGNMTWSLLEMKDFIANLSDDQLKSLGTTRDVIKDSEAMKKLFGEIASLYSNKESGVYEDAVAEEVYLSNYMGSYEELRRQRGNVSFEAFDKALKAIAGESLNTAENVYELAAAMNEAEAQGVEASVLEESYGKNLLRLAENYDLCAQAVEAYKQAQLTGNEELIDKKEQELEATLKLAQANEKLKYSDAFNINRTYDRKMEENERDFEKANQDTEDLIGAERVSAYENVNDILAKQTDDIEIQLDKARDRAKKAKEDLDGLLANENAPGIENGQITDYEKYMSYLVDQRNYYDSLTQDGNTSNDAAATTRRAQYDQQIEKVNEYIETLDEADDYVIQLNKDLEENNRKQLEKTIEKFEKAQDDFDSYVDTLESYKDFMQLIGDNDALTESLNAINDINKQAFDTAKIAYEQIRETAGSTPEQVAAAQKEMLDSMKAWTESLKEVVLNELKGFDKEFANAILGDMTFDEMTQNLQYAQSLQEEYLTDTNKIYETNKLINEAQKQIDATTNGVAKQKLKNFINQTKELEKQNKLSKFELDIRKAEYDVMLAEIALQEAQQAKSAVRLRRDSEGNFGYIYTADAGQVADAEQRLADAQNALYNIGLEGANKYAQRQVQITQEAQDAISQLTQQWINGEIESEEEYKRRVAETTDYYVAKYEEASNLLAKASMVDASIASESWAASFANQFKNLDDFEAKLNEYASKSAEAVDEYKETLETSVGEDSDLGKAFGEATKNAKDLAAALTGGGSSESESDTTPTNDAVEDYGEKTNEAVNNGGQALEDNLGDTADNADNLSSALSGGESEGGLNRALDAVNTTASKTVEVFNDLKTAIQQTVGEAYALRRHLQFMSENTFSVKYVVEQNVVSSASSYDTGGYTGQWGAAGKLAVLHEKEIVLNQDDTINLLASIELLRGIVDTLDVQTASQMMGGILTSPGYNNNYSNPIEQNVKIEASFPAVQDRNEIEEAFNNLINKASQYANRKK